MKHLLLTPAFISFSLWISAQSERPRSSDPRLAKLLDQRFPDDKITDMLGQAVRFSNESRPTLVNLWFTTCEPCIEEIPVLNQLIKKYGSKYNFVALTFDTRERIEKFKAKHTFDFPKALIPYHELEKIGITKYPLTFILTKDGKIDRIWGSVTKDDIEEVVSELHQLE